MCFTPIRKHMHPLVSSDRITGTTPNKGLSLKCNRRRRLEAGWRFEYQIKIKDAKNSLLEHQ